jgi:hypothetical protein
MSKGTRKDYYCGVSAKLRGRDRLVYEFLRAKGVKSTAIFRAGILATVKRLEEVYPLEIQKLYKDIAEDVLVGK